MTGNRARAGRRARTPIAASLQRLEAVVTKSHDGLTIGNDTAVVTKSLSRSIFGNDTAMFVRVRKRKLLKHGASASYEIVRGVRVNGKPTQKFLLGLGSLKTPLRRTHELSWFWHRALAKMRRHGLSESQRRRVVAAMIRKGAPKLSKAQCKRFCDDIKPDDFAELFGGSA
jgi:hypothetical protein